MSTAAPYTDRYDLGLTTTSADAAAHYRAAIECLQYGNVGAVAWLEQAVAADEGFALAHATLARTYQLSGNMDDAKASIARAHALAGGATRRERQQIAFLAAVVGNEMPRALALGREHLDDFPRDGFLLGQWRFLTTYSSEKDRQAQAYALLTQLAPLYGDDSAFLGEYGFVLHESDRFAESRALSERALTLYPRNATASHNVSHVFYETNDHESGIAFLDSWLPEYPTNAQGYGHLSWHHALFALASGQLGRLWDTYERSLRPPTLPSPTKLPDTASLLWRLHIYGAVDAPLAWQPVRDLAARLVAKPGRTFFDVHAALAYAGAGDDAAMEGLIEGLQQLAADGNLLAGDVSLPLVRGVAAFERGNYDETIREIAPVMPEVVRIGGSNAQREVFEDTLLQAYLRAGRYAEAEALLRTRLGRRESARDHLWLGEAQLADGKREAARTSLRDAADRWQDADADAPEVMRLTRMRQSASGSSGADAV
jgi:tetratricopeptide (TPR) repeat protein